MQRAWQRQGQAGCQKWWASWLSAPRLRGSCCWAALTAMAAAMAAGLHAAECARHFRLPRAGQLAAPACCCHVKLHTLPCELTTYHTTGAQLVAAVYAVHLALLRLASTQS